MYLRFTAKKWGDKLGRNWVKHKCANKVNRICTLVLKLFSSNDLLKEKFLNRGNEISFRREDFILCSAHPPLKMFLSVWWKGRDEDPPCTPPTTAPGEEGLSLHLPLVFLQRHSWRDAAAADFFTHCGVHHDPKCKEYEDVFQAPSYITINTILDLFQFQKRQRPPSPMHPHPNTRK